MERHFGKYRGVVADDRDPSGMGRVRVRVPGVLGDGTTAWAMPCVPFAGPGEGFLAVPAIGSPVWVEFEEGDLHRPIWVGGFWESGAEPPRAPRDGLVIAAGGATIRLEKDRITIRNGRGTGIEIGGDEIRIWGEIGRARRG